MTELELRSAYALGAVKWCGTKENTPAHRQLVAVYNSILPLPRCYALKLTDPWCAAFVSAVAWEAGFEKIMPLECSCPRMIDLAKEMGIWVENDAYEPQLGDWVLYNWQAGKYGDDTGSADHVGIVIYVQKDRYTVAEGNYDNGVKLRSIVRNEPTIRGFICPDFKSMAAKEETMKQYRSIEEAPEYARETLCKLTKDGSLLGVGGNNLGLTEDLIRILVILDRRGKL